jgi:homoserine O-acetyltransferase/O-succinyltransferase
MATKDLIMKRVKFQLPLAMCFLVAPSFAQELKFADLGDFPLEGGSTLRDCRVGYRTFGALNREKSNAVLFTTWYGGSTASLIGLIGPGKLVDSTRYFVIAIDALGNGVSTSPSNSSQQPHMKYPTITIGDMVNTEHRVVEDVLHVPHLRAVLGISMGGYQTFKWMVAYPDFMDCAIPIEGAPRPSSFDSTWILATSRALQLDPQWKGGDYTAPPEAGLRLLADIDALVLQTPSFRVEHTPPQDFEKFLEAKENAIVESFDPNNWIRQGQALLSQDVSRPFGGDMAKAAAAVRARVLVIVSLQDHEVVPATALAFAHLLHARTLELQSDCGHLMFQCDAATVSAAIAEFLME